MKHYPDYASYLADCTDVRPCSHKPPPTPYTWACSVCKAPFPHDTPYAVQREPRAFVCYTCAHARDVESLKDRSQPFGTYVSCDGQHVTTWGPGGHLGNVVQHSSYRGGFYRSTIHCYRVHDVHGAYWHGRNGGPGMGITLRPCK